MNYLLHDNISSIPYSTSCFKVNLKLSLLLLFVTHGHFVRFSMLIQFSEFLMSINVAREKLKLIFYQICLAFLYVLLAYRHSRSVS